NFFACDRMLRLIQWPMQQLQSDGETCEDFSLHILTVVPSLACGGSEIACRGDLPPFFDAPGWPRLIRIMFLRFNRRFKDGKQHCYWNIVENRRCAGGSAVQRQVWYLGEINDSQFEAWHRQIEAFDEGSRRHRQLALFPADREVPACADGYGVQVRL